MIGKNQPKAPRLLSSGRGGTEEGLSSSEDLAETSRDEEDKKAIEQESESKDGSVLAEDSGEGKWVRRTNKETTKPQSRNDSASTKDPEENRWANYISHRQEEGLKKGTSPTGNSMGSI